jgi:cobalt-zinc-cadmium efflux system protein
MGHHHHGSTKNLKWAFFLNFGFTLLELVGGVWTNSVAIMSDALHDMGDSLSLGMAWYLERQASKGPSKQYSFGKARFSLLGALITSVVLIIGSIFIIKEAVERIQEPEMPHAEGMLLFAIVGILVNGIAAWKLHGGESLNEKVVSWHLVEDLLGWVAVLVASIVLMFWNIPQLDAYLSIGITLFVLINVVKSFKQTMEIFLQKVPAQLDREEIQKLLEALDEVQSLHHLHIWSLEGQKHVLSVHLRLCQVHSFEDIMGVKQKAKEALSSFGFSHITIETELADDDCSNI